MSANRATVHSSAEPTPPPTLRTEAHKTPKGGNLQAAPSQVAKPSPWPSRPVAALSAPSEQVSQAHSLPGGPEAALRVPSRMPAALRESRCPTASPSRFRFRSAPQSMPPQTWLLAPPGAEPPRSRNNLSRPGPHTSAPSTHPPPGTCWPPWPFPPPPPAAQRGPGGSRGLGSARSEARSAGMALRGSPGRVCVASSSAASAVAVHSGPRCRCCCYRLTPGTPRPAPILLASSGMSSFLPDQSQAPAFPRPRRVPPDVGLRRPRVRLALPASPPSGTPSADPENKARHSAQVGEQDPTDRPLPERVRLLSASRCPALDYFRCSSAPPPRAGEEWSLTLSSLEPCSFDCGSETRAPSHFAWLFASGFACYLHEWSALPYPFRTPLSSFIPTPQGPGGAQPRPTKALGSDFVLFIAPQQAAGVGPRLGLPGSASGSIQCVLGCLLPPPGQCAAGNVSKSRKRSAQERVDPRSWGIIPAGRGHAAGPVGPVRLRLDIQGGGGGEGGGSRGRGGRGHGTPSAQHSPLEDAGVLAA